MPKKGEPSADLDTCRAAANTTKELGEHGIDLEPTKEDKATAKLSLLTLMILKMCRKKSPKENVRNIYSLVLTDSILKQFGRSVVESAVQIRRGNE